MTKQEQDTVSLALNVLLMAGCEVEGNYENGWNVLSGDMFGDWDCISVETVGGLIQVAGEMLNQLDCHIRPTLPCVYTY